MKKSEKVPWKVERVVAENNFSRPIQLHSITVYDYSQGPNSEPIKYEVDALCIGGTEGVFAIFPDPDVNDQFHLATGDDGHWVHIARYGEGWLELIIDCLTAYKGMKKKSAAEPWQPISNYNEDFTIPVLYRGIQIYGDGSAQPFTAYGIPPLKDPKFRINSFAIVVQGA